MKILIVDDVLVSHSLKVLLSHEESLEVVGTAVDRTRAIAACGRSLPDVVLMNIPLPGMDRIAATRRVKPRWPQVRVMILTTFQDDQSIQSALRAGADGYLLKSTASAGMAVRLHAVAAGTGVVDAAVLKRLSKPPGASLPGLTPRENDVADLVAQGMSNREIAAQLFIGDGTARNILSGILQKLACATGPSSPSATGSGACRKAGRARLTRPCIYAHELSRNVRVCYDRRRGWLRSEVAIRLRQCVVQLNQLFYTFQ